VSGHLLILEDTRGLTCSTQTLKVNFFLLHLGPAYLCKSQSSCVLFLLFICMSVHVC